jgi:hypothetical protein
MAIDRAAVAAQAVMQITSASSVPKPEQQRHLENLLRDEFDAVRREAVADRRPDEDA